MDSRLPVLLLRCINRRKRRDYNVPKHLEKTSVRSHNMYGVILHITIVQMKFLAIVVLLIDGIGV